MTAGGFYTGADCLADGPRIPLNGRVIVLDPAFLPEEERCGLRQLAVCLEQAAEENGGEGLLAAVSLAHGEYERWSPRAVLGVLRPDLLPESAKLQLSQVRPGCLRSSLQRSPPFTGYCFLPDGRYTVGIGLEDEQEAAAYALLQSSYQHRVLICNSEALGVLEMIDGKLRYTASGLRAALDQALSGPDSPS